MPRRPKWKLSKTLKRRIEIRPVEQPDLKYIWAAYKQGALCEITEDEGLDAEEFAVAFEDELAKYDGAWMIDAETNRGMVPIGMVLGFWHPFAENMVTKGFIPFPWASTRNLVEGLIKFFNEVRGQVQMTIYAKHASKRLYVVALQHGIMRRIGTSHNVWPDEEAAIYETRTPKWSVQ